LKTINKALKTQTVFEPQKIKNLMISKNSVVGVGSSHMSTLKKPFQAGCVAIEIIGTKLSKYQHSINDYKLLF